MPRRKRRRSKLPVFVTAGVVTAALAGWLILRQSAEDALPAPERSGEQADFRRYGTECPIRVPVASRVAQREPGGVLFGEYGFVWVPV